MANDNRLSVAQQRQLATYRNLFKGLSGPERDAAAMTVFKANQTKPAAPVAIPPAGGTR